MLSDCLVSFDKNLRAKFVDDHVIKPLNVIPLTDFSVGEVEE